MFGPNLKVGHHGEVRDNVSDDFIFESRKIASHGCDHSKAINHYNNGLAK